MYSTQEKSSEADAGVLKKLSLAGLAELSRVSCSWLRFGLASAGYRGLGVLDRSVYMYIALHTAQPANSQMIPQSMMKYLELARLGNSIFRLKLTHPSSWLNETEAIFTKRTISLTFRGIILRVLGLEI